MGSFKRWLEEGDRREVPAPKRTVKGYKIFNLKGGRLYPAMVRSRKHIPVGKWLEAEFEPTRGLKPRGGWHMTALPLAPQMRSTRTKKMAKNRVWAECEMGNSIEVVVPPEGQIPGGYYKHKQGRSEWLIGGVIRVNRVLTDAEVKRILIRAGYPEDAEAEQHG